MANPGKGPGDGLTPQQAEFVRQYLVDLNATQAAIRAGYSERTARQQGARLLANANVLAALSQAQARRAERVQIDADWVLARLALEADADLADILDDAGAIRPVADWPLIWRQGLVAGIDVHEEIVDGATVGQTVKVKLSDRIKRLELIGKHIAVGAFRERLEHTGPDGGPIQTEDVTPRERIADRLAMLAGKNTSDQG